MAASSFSYGAPHLQAPPPQPPAQAPPPQAPPPQPPPAQAPPPQVRLVTGVVRSGGNGKPIAGATILTNASEAAAVSAPDGTFSLELPITKVTLLVSHEEFDAKEMEIDVGKLKGPVDVALGAGKTSELVIIGRATRMERKHLTNSMGTVREEDLSRAPAQTLDQALQAKVAGAN